MKKTSIVLFIAIAFSSCIADNALVRDLDLDANWYCNFWGSLVVNGSITNDGTQRVSGVELKVRVNNADGTTDTERITIRKSIAAGNTIQFKEYLSHTTDEYPDGVNVVIVDAW